MASKMGMCPFFFLSPYFIFCKNLLQLFTSPWHSFLYHSERVTNLQSGRLIALFELAGMSAFGCSQIVGCIRRSQDAAELEVVRNLGWCGFSLTTLNPWVSDGCCSESTLSPRWIFLCAEV